MDKITDSTPSDDIHEITLWELWGQGMSPQQIAEEIGVSIDLVYRRLKAMQKRMVKEAGVEDHANKSNT
jgi:transposase